MTIDVYTDSDDVIIDVGTDTRETPEIVTDALYGPKGEKGDKGDTGATGADGQDGEDGFSPIATVSKSGSVATITITDKNGTTTAEVYDGSGTGLVNSVNGETGDVVLTASDVGALPNTTTIPTKTSDLTNDSGFITNSALANYTQKTYVDAQDSNLQSQIDALVVSSDVFDIVGTYAELQAYDISTVPVNDIIKVLVDSTHSNAATYYRCVETGGVKSWSYIGSEGAYYTKSEADSLLNAKYDASNPDGFISGITGADVTNALGYTPYNSTNPAGYIDSSALTPYELKNKTINTPSTSGTIELTDNSINSITPSGNITFTLPTIADNTVFHEIMVQINLSTVYTIDVGTTYYFNKTAPDLSTAGTYNLYYEYDKATQQWYCGALSKGTVS